MRTISMRGAWSHGVSLLFGDWKTAATYLGMAVAVPFLLFSIHDGSNFRTFFALVADQGVFAASSETPWTILSLFIFSAIAYLSVAFAWWNAVLPESRDGVVGEVMYGLVAGLISFVVSVAIYLLINLPFMIIAIVGLQMLGGSNPAPVTALIGGSAYLAMNFVQLAVVLWFNARLSMTGPAMAATGSLNPFPGLARSWQLTGQAQWRVLVFLLLCQIIAYVALAAFLVGAVTLITGTYDFGWQDRVISIGWMLLELMLMALYLVVSGGLYRELVGETDITVFE